MNKKAASIGALYPAVLMVVLVGIVLGVGLYILTATSDAISSDAKTVVNESGIDLDVAGGTTLAGAAFCGANNFVITSVNNGSDVLGAGNYSVDRDTGVIVNETIEYQDTTPNLMNVSYTYSGANDQSATGYCKTLTTTATGLGGLADWIAVIVVVLAAAIVLGIVLSSFGRGSSV